MAAPDCTLYRPRRAQATPLYRLVQAHYADVRNDWEEQYEGRYGFWRGFTDKAVGGYLDCGILENGFARVRCGACHAEFLVAFSCKGRGLCPSCAAKRAAALAAFLREEVLADVGHVQWVFSIPKMLRPQPTASLRSDGSAAAPLTPVGPCFLYHRPLLGRLCQAAYQTAREMISAVSVDSEPLLPGMIAVVQTFGDDAGWHPHVHALATCGGWDRAGTWAPVPFIDGEAAALVFRHKVLRGRHDAAGDHNTQPPPFPRGFGPRSCSPRLAARPTPARSRSCRRKGCCPRSARGYCCPGATPASPSTPQSPCRPMTATASSASPVTSCAHP